MPAGAGWVACRRQPEGRHEREAKEATGSEHQRESAMVQGQVNSVAQGGQPERLGGSAPTLPFFTRPAES